MDAIVFATGYSLVSIFSLAKVLSEPNDQEPTNLHVRGLNGKTIREYFDEKGGPTAYLGSNFPGFPNLCYIIGAFACLSPYCELNSILAGANAATGHASLLFDMEAQVQLAVQLAAPVINRKLYSLTVKEKVTDDYNTWIQSRIATSVWPECGESYYYVDGTRRTKNIAMFPGPATMFWWFARKPNWGEWDMFGSGGQRLTRKPRGLVDRDVVCGMKVLGAISVLLFSWISMRN